MSNTLSAIYRKWIRYSNSTLICISGPPFTSATSPKEPTSTSSVMESPTGTCLPTALMTNPQMSARPCSRSSPSSSSSQNSFSKASSRKGTSRQHHPKPMRKRPKCLLTSSSFNSNKTRPTPANNIDSLSSIMKASCSNMSTVASTYPTSKTNNLMNSTCS